MNRRTLVDRLDRLEQRLATRSLDGADFFAAMVLAHRVCHPDPSEVFAIEIGHDRARERVERRPGEPVDALLHRANPSGTWHAAPSPIFDDHQRGETEVVEIARLTLHNCMTYGARTPALDSWLRHARATYRGTE